MKAIIVTGGKQYTVAEGDVLFIEKLNAEAEQTVKFDQVLAVLDGENSKVGTPVVEGAAVEAKVVKNGKGKKIDIIRYKAKKNEKRHIGHRQPYTKVEITKIGAPVVEGAAVEAKVVKNGKGKKLDIIRYKAKKNEKRHIGHRQPYTKVEITKIAL